MISPMLVEIASAATVYVGLSLFMRAHLVALGLLFRREVTAEFKGLS